MKKLVILILLILVVSLFLASTVIAAPGKPVGACVRGTKLMPLPPGVNPIVDRNGDGYVCLRARSAARFYYIDNYVRIRCRR